MLKESGECGMTCGGVSDSNKLTIQDDRMGGITSPSQTKITAPLHPHLRQKIDVAVGNAKNFH